MTPSRLHFRLEAQAAGSRARAATFRTLHNEVRTPLFMPVGTQATVKGQLTETLAEAGSQILLANTYHLLLRPGGGGVSAAGGDSSVYALGEIGADGFGRVSDFFAAAFAFDE